MKKAIISLGACILLVGLVGCKGNMSSADEDTLRENMTRDLREDEIADMNAAQAAGGDAMAEAFKDAPPDMPPGKGPRTGN